MEKMENCPTCGAEIDKACVYPDGEAYCMECGEIWRTGPVEERLAASQAAQ